MFKRPKEVVLTLTSRERRLLQDCLLRWRNQLIAEGKCADPVNELLEKLMK
ncbi:MAG: hypothetical protein HFF09_07965 [Oscillospiraceae bacterium]|nr:hypothetical protein [Oscillospiraceae bacterium]